MSEHTPGPWRISEDDQGHLSVRGTWGTTDCTIAKMYWIAEGANSTYFVRADAKLIAAAPELAEALRDVCHELRRTYVDMGCAPEGTAKSIDALSRPLTKAREALAKAGIL